MSYPTKKRKKANVSFIERQQLQHLCDGTVLCADDGKSFPVHRILMAVASPFFRAAFTSEGSREVPTSCKVSNVKSDVLQKVIHFVEYGEIDLTDDNISDMILAGHHFQISDLRKECRDFVLSDLSVANCSAIYSTLLLLEEDHDLGGLCHRFILANFERVSKSDAFRVLSPSVLESFLQRDDLNVSGEEAVREAVLSWAGPGRPRPLLLSHVRRRGRWPRPIAPERCHVVVDARRRKCYVTYDDVVDLVRPVADLPAMTLDAVAGDSTGRVFFVQGERCWWLDLPHNRFVPVPDLRLRLNRYGTAVVDGSLYVVGGDLSNHSGSTVVKAFDPDLGGGQWRGLRLTQYPVRGPVAVVKGKIYALGQRCRSLSKRLVVTFECYDPERDSWRLQPPMPVAGDDGEVFSAWSDGAEAFFASRRRGEVVVSEYDTVAEEWRESVSYSFEHLTDPKISVVRGSPVLYEGDPNAVDPKAFIWNQSLNKWCQISDPFLRNLRQYTVFCVDDSMTLEKLKHRETYTWQPFHRA